MFGFKNILCVSLLCSVVLSDCGFENIKIALKDYEGEKEATVNTLNGLQDAIEIKIVKKRVPKLCSGAVKNLRRLDTFILEKSETTEVQPGAFADVSFLRIIKINGNNINTIKKGVFNNLNVRTLELNNNKIVNIDHDAFDDMPELETLELNYNNIKTVDPKWLNKCPKMHRLNLQGNQIEKVKENSFPNLAGRQVDIWLMNNKIDEIENNAFKGIEDFGFLWLHDNKIRNIEAQVFPDVKSIENLSLSNNKLTCLSDAFLNKISVAKSFNVDENPMDCECFKKIKEFTKAHNITSHFSIIRIQCLQQKIAKMSG